MTSTGHVFVSHSSDNRELANELAAFLEGRGVRVWIAPRDVRPGMDYSEQLQLAIENAVAFVVLVTDMANKSPYVRAETEMAFSTHKPIFPVRISDIQPAAGLALFLKIRHWTDAYGASRSANLDRLAQELQHLTGVGAAADAAPPAAGPAPAQASAPTPAANTAPLAAMGAAATAAPRAAAKPALPAAPATPEEEEKWRAAVGPNADLYLLRWKQMAERKSAVSWNWAACLANFYWFAYRKMWLAAGAMGVVYLANIAAMGNKQASGTIGLLTIGITFVTGTFGTYLYRQQTARLVAQTAGQEREAALETLRRRGGVSQPALYASIAAVVLLVLVAAAIFVRKQQPVPVPPVPFDNGTTNDPFNTNTDQPPVDPDKPVGVEEPALEPEPEPEPYPQEY